MGDGSVSVQELDAVSETLLIPLLARARARARYPQLGFADPEAERIVTQLDLDPERFGDDRASAVGCILRSRWFDVRALAFFDRHPTGVGVSLGAGLDTRFQRLDAVVPGSRFDWVDIDLPGVIELKRRLVRETPRYRLLAHDLRDLGWTDRVGARARHPALFIAEGVLMYLRSSEVQNILAAIACRFSQSGAVRLLFDYCSPLMARHGKLHLSVGQTRVGRGSASPFLWSLRGAAELARIDPRWRVVEEHDLTRHCGPMPALVGALYGLLTDGQHFYALAHAALAGSQDAR